VSENQAAYPIATMCRLLGVSPSGYYEWVKRRPSRRARANAELSEQIRIAHAGSRGTYGSPRVQAELAAQGIRAGRKRIARLMAESGLAGVSRRKFVTTTMKDGGRQAPDLVERDFTAERPDLLWVADITYIPTWGGFLYLAVVLDAFSRRIVGWSMSTSLATQLVLDALNMALAIRRPNDVIHHSDQGSQYTSIAFGHRCREAGVRPSMGSVGDAYDNAMCESFFATLECELLDRRRFKTQAEARMAAFEFIEGFYNPASQHPSVYVVEGKRVCCPGQGPLGCHARFRARSAIVCADGASRSERLKIHGPSANGWTASISPPSAASRSVFWLIPRSLAARVRFSQGSTPSAAGRQTGMRW
jgi:putative transposase